jgi:hypothetical protein
MSIIDKALVANRNYAENCQGRPRARLHFRRGHGQIARSQSTGRRARRLTRDHFSLLTAAHISRFAPHYS